MDPSVGATLGGNADSVAPLINSNATHVLFASSADNLVTATNGHSIQLTFPAKINVYLRNRTNATTLLVSQNLSGTGGGNGDSIPADISADGSLVLFESTAGDLVGNDTNGVTDIFLRNITNNTTTLVSVSTAGRSPNGASRSACMSADGRYVAFVSAGSNLVVGDTNGIPDVFVRDLQANTTTLVSVGATSASITSSSESPEISDDGRYVVFYSSATNLIPGVAATAQIYVRDLFNGTTTLASSYASTALNAVLNTTSAVCYNHALSSDGNFVIYETSRASGTRNPGIILRYHLADGGTDVVCTNAFVPFNTAYENIRTLDITPDGRFTSFLADTNGNTGVTTCVEVWDGVTGVVTLASGDASDAVPAGSSCEWPTVDASGRYVLFANSGSVLANNASGTGIYVRDLQFGTTTLISVNDTNAIALNSPLVIPRMSANGQTTIAGCVDQGIFGNTLNVFAFDLQSAASEIVSAHIATGGMASANGASFLSPWAVSDTGRYIAFSSFGKNVVAGDTNLNRDVFVRDLLTGSNTLVSIGLNGSGASGASSEAAISPDGQFVAFTSTATNLVGTDTTATPDVFVANLQNGKLALGSISTSGTSAGNGPSYSPRLSTGGKYLLFRSTASNLATGTFLSGSANLFLRNLVTSNTIALTTNGMLAADMTPDGRYIAYVLANGTLCVWDTQLGYQLYPYNTAGAIGTIAISTNGMRMAFAATNQLFVATRQTNSTWIVSSIATFNSAARPTIAFSADAKCMVYTSGSSQGLSLDDINGVSDVFVYDFSTLSKIAVSRAYNASAMANTASDQPAISADGRYIAFRSSATNLVAGVTNGLSQIFLYDRANTTNTLLTSSTSGSAGNYVSQLPVFSGDGRTVLLSSWSSDLASQDLNQVNDLFAFRFLYTSVLNNPDGGITISWPATAGRNYKVQFKDSLGANSWQDLNGSIVVLGNTATMEDPASPAQRFYRVISF